MGCVQSRKDINDVHPNVFRVINIDEAGCGLWAGQLEVTEQELVLYRRGKEPTRWPLRCLRRYGFDREIFSFESGRRCMTGQGIYAFKCRRAQQLFDTLQQCIQVRNLNMDGGGALESLASESQRAPGTLPRPPPHLLPAQHAGEYLEPAPPRLTNHLRSGSISSGPLSPEVHSPGSPSSANILEVTPLAPLPAGPAQVTNLYQFQDFPLQHREHNNNRKYKPEAAHSYSNTGEILNLDADLAVLRHSMLQKQLTQNDDDAYIAEAPEPAETTSRGSDNAPLSPTLSSSSERYATLAVQQLYMNLAPGETAAALTAIREENATAPPSACEPNTPGSNAQTPLNGNFNFNDFLEIEEEKHNYINLGPGEVNYDPRLLIRQCSKPPRGITLAEAHSIEEEESTNKINYAILDIPGESSASALPPASPTKKPPVGYTTIDFNKTGALTQVARGTEVDTEGSRKTRHNSTALPSPTIT